MIIESLLISSFLAVSSVDIMEPVDGFTYSGDWLTVLSIVENDNVMPDSVHYSLNGGTSVQIPRLSTDWPTYMQNYVNHGYSPSPGPETSEILWAAPVCGTSHEFCNPTVADGKVFFLSDEYSTAYAFDAATGDELWSYFVVDNVDDAITYFDGKVYIAADSAWCLDAESGFKIWSYGGPSGTYISGSPVATEEVCYIVNPVDADSMVVVALDASNGEVIWSVGLPGYYENCLAYADNTLYLAAYTKWSSAGTNSLLALDSQDGQIIWANNHVEGYWDSSPTIYEGLLYIGGDDGKIHAFDTSDGSLVWEMKIHPQSEFAGVEPTASVNGDALFTGCSFYGVYELGAVSSYGTDTGNLLWSLQDEIELHGSIGLSSEYAYLGGHRADTIYALNQETGDIVWEYAFQGGAQVGIQSTPSITDGVMYIAATNGNLYAFGTGLKYSYRNDLFAQVGVNELIVTSFSEGSPVAADTISFTVTCTGISALPSSVFSISSSPNPFISVASISFELEQYGFASVEIFDVSGRTVKSLVDEELSSGRHTFQWSGIDNNGEEVPSGIYYCRIQSQGAVETACLCLLR